ncbi:hypothetical protein BHE74_00034459 [Ensete ventricosum]|nr:hypothetical protein BHE74_00034459 [Ensete ventricosum]RZS11552.1 hypothetical protein BHM03_00042898 [Ensete ventricosum]
MSKLIAAITFSYSRLMMFDLYFQIPHLRPAQYKSSRLSRNRRTVNRAYGGVLSGSAVRERLAVNAFELVYSWIDIADPIIWKLWLAAAAVVFISFCLFYRIIRAFLVEEQKIVKKVLKIQKAKEKQASKS